MAKDVKLLKRIPLEEKREIDATIRAMGFPVDSVASEIIAKVIQFQSFETRPEGWREQQPNFRKRQINQWESAWYTLRWMSIDPFTTRRNQPPPEREAARRTPEGEVSNATLEEAAKIREGTSREHISELMKKLEEVAPEVMEAFETIPFDESFDPLPREKRLGKSKKEEKTTKRKRKPADQRFAKSPTELYNNLLVEIGDQQAQRYDIDVSGYYRALTFSTPGWENYTALPFIPRNLLNLLELLKKMKAYTRHVNKEQPQRPGHIAPAHSHLGRRKRGIPTSTSVLQLTNKRLF